MIRHTLFRNTALRALAAASLGLGASLAATAAPAAAQDASSAPQVPEMLEKRIPAGEFVKQANMRSVRISPDGNRLAYLANNSGRQVLVTLDLNNIEAGPKLILEAEEARESGQRSLAGFRWIGNEHVVMTVISRENINGQLGDFRRLVAYDVTDGELVQQAWRNAGGDAGVILHIDHDTGKYLLQRDAISENTERWGYPEVVEVDVNDGKYSYVQRTNPVVTGWQADGNGTVRVGGNYDSDTGKQRILYRSEDESNFKTVYNEADATFTESLPAPEVFVPGTDDAYVTSREDGYTKVYRMNMQTMQLGEPVFEVAGHDVDGVISSPDGNRVLGYVSYENGQREAVYTDEMMKQLQTMLEEVFGENEAQIVDWSDDFSKIVVFGGGLNRVGAYYLYDTQTGQLGLLAWQSASLKDAPINPMRAETYTASDGTEIEAIITMPRHREGQTGLPVVVMPHGGPFGVKDTINFGFASWHQALAEQGYVVIQPNYRGSGGYGKEFEKMGREPGGYGMRMQDDLNDAVTAFAAKGLIDADRACIMGWSYGGYAAARGAQRDPDVWRCAVAGAGVYDMPLMNEWDRKNLGRFSEGFQATSDNPQAISPALHPEGEWAPILIVAAKRDARIPMEQAEALVGALRRAGKSEGTDFKYIVQEQGTHNLPYDDVHMQWIEEAHAWIEKHNPAYVPADGDEAPAVVAMN
ncbi:S9 family peptidase [Erythrobacter sp.]|jgi:dipeptidyl aminopeptidase/acylaminoacyl peptidase|uniref:S9 family peptidase n=1 Tax=Erythrobacter sp. TaxID=1042 RepID=UPI002EA3A559|nr:alpha/beta fold hydrolase [Erythrobacter sp.]